MSDICARCLHAEEFHTKSHDPHVATCSKCFFETFDGKVYAHAFESFLDHLHGRAV